MDKFKAVLTWILRQRVILTVCGGAVVVFLNRRLHIATGDAQNLWDAVVAALTALAASAQVTPIASPKLEAGTKVITTANTEAVVVSKEHLANLQEKARR